MTPNFFQAANVKKVWVESTQKSLRWHSMKLWVDFKWYPSNHFSVCRSNGRIILLTGFSNLLDEETCGQITSSFKPGNYEPITGTRRFNLESNPGKLCFFYQFWKFKIIESVSEYENTFSNFSCMFPISILIALIY